jgi:esterase/lipase
MNKKYIVWLGGICFLFIILLVTGPRVRFSQPVLLDHPLQLHLSQLDSAIMVEEASVKGIKADNEARIIWANDSTRHQTEYALVYLHGFSASQEEGDPVHEDVARRYGMNLFLSRLEDHGRLDSNSFFGLTPDNYMESAEKALEIGRKLGKKVILMSCSTGGTLSLALTAAGADVHSLIMYSPNIDIADPASDIVLWPWGKQIGQWIMGGNYNRINYDTLAQKYWNQVYHINGIFAVKGLIRQYMHKETFQKIKIPVFIGYYYKDEEHQDNVVSVSRMLECYDQLATPVLQKRLVNFPQAANHVISSHVMSKDIPGVRQATYQFVEEILKIQPVL